MEEITLKPIEGVYLAVPMKKDLELAVGILEGKGWEPRRDYVSPSSEWKNYKKNTCINLGSDSLFGPGYFDFFDASNLSRDNVFLTLKDFVKYQKIEEEDIPLARRIGKKRCNLSRDVEPSQSKIGGVYLPL